MMEVALPVRASVLLALPRCLMSTEEALVTERGDLSGPVAVTDRGTLGVLHSSPHNSGLPAQPLACKLLIRKIRRDVRVVEGARLESVCRGNSTVGSNPTLSAN